jgi:hypothetical protein
MFKNAFLLYVFIPSRRKNLDSYNLQELQHCELHRQECSMNRPEPLHVFLQQRSGEFFLIPDIPFVRGYDHETEEYLHFLKRFPKKFNR